MWFNIFILIVYFLGVFGDIPPLPSVAPCRRDDVKCLTKILQWGYSATIVGVPEFAIESSEPMYLEKIEANLPSVNFSLKRNLIKGYKNCKVNEARLTTNLSTIHIAMACPRVRFDGDYEIDGNILSFPIKGKGDYFFEVTNYHMGIDCEIKITKKEDGNTYVAFKNFKFLATLFGDLDLDLRNLFEGRKDLSEPVLNFARQNGRAFSSVLQDPIIGSNIKKVLKNFNKFLKTIPLSKLIFYP